MRVAVIGSYPVYPYREQLGIPNIPKRRESLWHIPLAEGLARLEGIDLHVIVTTHRVPEDKTISGGNFTIHYLRIPKGFNYLTFFELVKLRIHKKLHEITPDIVHGHSTEHGYPYVAVTSKFPTVVTFHNIISKLAKELNLSFFSPHKIRYTMLAQLEKRTLRKAKHIIVASPFMKEALSPLTAARIHVVTHSSVDERFFNAESCEEDRRLLFIGDIRPEKRILDLIKAAKIVTNSHKDVLLRIIGPNLPQYQSYYSQLLDFINTNNLGNNVVFLGYKDTNEIIQELSKSQMLILPSEHEPLGLVLGESMAVGIPVIGTKTGGIPHVVKDQKTGFLIEVGDIEGLAKHISILLNNLNLRREMGKKGKEESKKRFHPTAVAQKTRAVYEQVLSEGKTR